MTLSRRNGRQLGSAVISFLITFVSLLALLAICECQPFGTKRAFLYSDCYHQYYPFFTLFRRTLRSGGSLLYSWDVGMGVDFLGLIAYYLGSPLNLLSVLVPDGWVLGYFCMLMPIKLSLASAFFAYMLEKIYRRSNLSVSLFGCLYGLCAWALGYQWNVMWLDTFALLPLVILGMVQLLRDRRCGLYTIALFLSVFANYYIGLFTCFFVFLAFFCYEISRFRGWKRFFGDFACIALYSVLALGMTAVLSITSLSALQTTQSSVNKFPTDFRLNIAKTFDFAGLMDAMRQVAGNFGGTVSPTFKEGLPNVACGVCAVFFGFLFLLSDSVKLREKICAVVLLLFLNVSFIIRQLDYIWHGFHFPNMIPYRFSFLVSFVLLFLAYKGWILRRRVNRVQIIAAAILSGAVLACSNDLLSSQTVTFLEREWKLYLYIIYNAGFLLLYTVCMLVSAYVNKPADETDEAMHRAARRTRKRRMVCKYCVRTVTALELIFALATFSANFPATSVSNYPSGTENAARIVNYMYEREEERELFFRAETTHSQTLNDGALNGFSGISAFTSSANVHITEFLKALGYGAKNTYNRYCFEESSPVSNLFLNLKYMIDRDGKDKSSAFFEKIIPFGQVGLYENTSRLPLGFLTDAELGRISFMTGDDSFRFQNQLFRAATGIPADVWQPVPGENLDIIGNGADVSNQSSAGFCNYANCVSGANVIYSYVADREGFACIRLDFPKRNDFYVSINGTEIYRENISLPQMIAVGDVHVNDVIDIRVICKEGDSGSLNVSMAILDNDLFSLGYEILNESTLQLTSFEDTLVEGKISCGKDGLLYTSIPQNGNWFAYVDGEPAEITLVGDCMISVLLTQGEHTVRFEYHNRAFTLGAGISAASAALFVLAMLISKRKRKLPETKAGLPVFHPEEPIASTSAEQPITISELLPEHEEQPQTVQESDTENCPAE